MGFVDGKGVSDDSSGTVRAETSVWVVPVPASVLMDRVIVEIEEATVQANCWLLQRE